MQAGTFTQNLGIPMFEISGHECEHIMALKSFIHNMFDDEWL